MDLNLRNFERKSHLKTQVKSKTDFKLQKKYYIKKAFLMIQDKTTNHNDTQILRTYCQSLQ